MKVSSASEIDRARAVVLPRLVDLHVHGRRLEPSGSSRSHDRSADLARHPGGLLLVDGGDPAADIAALDHDRDAFLDGVRMRCIPLAANH
jgi:hypothetical protein